MTEQQRLTIRCELARRMGWGYSEKMRLWIAPNVSHTRQWPPDPFTDAADNRALVEWLAAQDEEIQEMYQYHLVRIMSWDDSDKRGALVDVLIFQTAPLEAITLAAARALGIGEEE